MSGPAAIPRSAGRQSWRRGARGFAAIGARFGPERIYFATLTVLEDFSDAIHRVEVRDLRSRVATILAPMGALVGLALCQPQALGLGHAILCAASVVGDAPFAVVLADDLIDADPPVLRQMTDAFGRHGASLVAVQKVARSETRQYGIVKLDGRRGGDYRMTGIVEKPAPSTARRSSIRCSRVGMSPARSERPVPRLSKRMSREKPDSRPRKRAKEGSFHAYSTWETQPITNTRSTGRSRSPGTRC